eukprot:SAG11_NODE_24316_length_375_cov_0.677536_1_plen_52_part_01
MFQPAAGGTATTSSPSKENAAGADHLDNETVSTEVTAPPHQHSVDSFYILLY